MKETDNELLDRLLEENEGMKKAYYMHREYDRQVKKLDRKICLTPSEKVERKRLQKLKLLEKDKMEYIISGYKERCSVA